MIWKNWPRWLKGGIIFTAIFYIFAILLIIFSIVTLRNSPPSTPFDFLGIVFLIMILFLLPLIIFAMLFGIAPENIFSGMTPSFGQIIILILGLLLNTLFIFLVGALIGWFFGKIKSKNNLK